MDDLAVCWATFRRRITSHLEGPSTFQENLEVTCMLSWQSLRKRWTLSQVSSSSPRPPRSRPKVSIPQCSYTRKSLRAACVFVHHAWSAWSGDAATAFLQGQQEERPLPLHLSPPRDGLIALTDTWILTIGLNQVGSCELHPWPLPCMLPIPGPRWSFALGARGGFFGGKLK